MISTGNQMDKFGNVLKRLRMSWIGICFILFAVTGHSVIESNAEGTHGKEDLLSMNSATNDIKQVDSISNANISFVKVENGVPKISINGQIDNNIFGVYVY